MGTRGKLKLVPAAEAVDDGEFTAHHATKSTGFLKTKAVKTNKQLSEVWDEFAPQVESLKFHTKGDSIVMELLCRHILAMRIASDQFFDDDSATYESWRGDRVKNPNEVVFRQESDQILKIANMFGMTFQSRARTPMQHDEEEENPFASNAG